MPPPCWRTVQVVAGKPTLRFAEVEVLHDGRCLWSIFALLHMCPADLILHASQTRNSIGEPLVALRGAVDKERNDVEVDAACRMIDQAHSLLNGDEEVANLKSGRIHAEGPEFIRALADFWGIRLILYCPGSDINPLQSFGQSSKCVVLHHSQTESFSQHYSLMVPVEEYLSPDLDLHCKSFDVDLTPLLHVATLETGHNLSARG